VKALGQEIVTSHAEFKVKRKQLITPLEIVEIVLVVTQSINPSPKLPVHPYMIVHDVESTRN
jgi:hypothetical protein